MGGAIFDALQQEAQVGGALPHESKATRLPAIQALVDIAHQISQFGSRQLRQALGWQGGRLVGLQSTADGKAERTMHAG